MTERTYTVEEIDRMREALKRRHAPWHYGIGLFDVEKGALKRAFARAEDELRTYMLAGVDPLEVIAAVKVELEGTVMAEGFS